MTSQRASGSRRGARPSGRAGQALLTEDRDHGPSAGDADPTSTALADPPRPVLVFVRELSRQGSLPRGRVHFELQQAARSERNLDPRLWIALAKPPVELGRESAPRLADAVVDAGGHVEAVAPCCVAPRA